jgi:hypothetical protein
MAAASLVTTQAEEPATQGTVANPPRIEIARVRVVEFTEPQFRLAEGQVDLMEGFNLSTAKGVGGVWQTPSYIAVNGDPFGERYGAWEEPASTK